MTDVHSSQAARFGEEIMPHLDSAYSLARYLCRDGAEAQDIAHDALLKAWRAFAGFRGGEPKAWLLAIVRNAYIDWTRRTRRWRAMTQPGEDVDEMTELADPDQPSAEAVLIARGDAAALRGAIEALPEAFREVVVLRDLEALSYQAIARATGVPIGTVMSRLARARQRLCAALAPAEGAAP